MCAHGNCNFCKIGNLFSDYLRERRKLRRLHVAGLTISEGEGRREGEGTGCRLSRSQEESDEGERPILRNRLRATRRGLYEAVVARIETRTFTQPMLINAQRDFNKLQ